MAAAVPLALFAIDCLHQTTRPDPPPQAGSEIALRHPDAQRNRPAVQTLSAVKRTTFSSAHRGPPAQGGNPVETNLNSMTT